jgi:TonB family protein
MTVTALILRSSVVLIAGLVAAALMRRQPAALRHSIIAAALVLAAAQPIINRVIPALTLPRIAWTVETVADEPRVAVESEFALEKAIPAPPKPAAGVDWSRVLFVTWVTGVAINLAVLLAGMAWLLRLQSRSRSAGAEWLAIEASLRSQMGDGSPARIVITRHPALIVTWGVITPAILLPADADTWSIERKRMVIAHEAAHLLRRDWLTQVVAEIARSINWFNPLFWLACATLRRESEHAADDLVLDTGITGTSYASDLVALARTLRVHGRTWLPAPSIARPSTLERRVRAMLNPQLNRRPVSRAWQFVLMALLCAIALPIAAASQAASAPSGMVVDPMDRPLADAVVRLSAIANNEQAYETRTDANGAFKFNAVTPGDYMLSIRYPGFSSSRQRVQLRAGEFTFTLKAQVGTLQETISVRAGGTGSTATSRSEQSAPVPEAPSCSATGAGELTPPMKIRDVRPRYKQAWVDAGIEGTILMQARIGRDGYVRSVNALSPTNPELEDEAVAAVSQWRFSPTYLNCSPIEVEMYVTVSFKLER